MILIITGNGKGKSTSAMGTLLRACGWNKRSSIVFFDKGGSHYGEQNIFDLLQDKLDVFRFGLERFNENEKSFRFENTIDDKIEAELALKKSFSLLNENYFLIVCDEIINCMNLGLINEDEVKFFVNSCPAEVNLILTGRNAPSWLIEKADLVSEINEVKHYYKKDVESIKGLDY